MVRRRAPKKTKEEKLAENFFPVDEDDVKRAVEKKEKQVEEKSLEEVEKVGKKKTRKPRKTAKTKGKRKSSKTVKKEFKIPKTSLKEGGYELIITEKPQAALKIASALGKSKKNSVGNVPYYDVERKGKKIIVACAVGHLFTLKQENPGQEIPIFEIKWIPNFMARKKDFTKRYYDLLLKLVKNAGSVTIATDYDVEGEVIGLNVMRFICGQKDANRMKFSTLTDKELNKSYDEKNSTIDWGQAIAGETRHYLDWIYGINLSRALMNSFKSIGKFKIMSIGRVQGPTLKILEEKEKQIKKFKSEPYWQTFINVKNSEELELKHNKDISKESELEKFRKLKGKKINLETNEKEQLIPPNPPFNLTGLQTESYNLYGITPARTLQIAQSLYLGGLISYPRTSSQKLPDSIAYNEILEKMANKYNANSLIKRRKPVEGKKTDPAHPSIYPTGQSSSALSDEEKKIQGLIERRFLALFCEDAIVMNKKVNGEVDNLKFSVSGSSIDKKSWMEIYPVKLKEKEIPTLNGEFEIKDVKIEKKMTQPPRRYSQASILSILEKKNLGTKATRSSILETLYNRGYIKEKSIEVTPLGMSLIETLEKYSPIIVNEKLTRNFEKEMEEIQNSKSKFEEKEKKVLEQAKSSINEITNQFKKYEKEIGNELLKANINLTNRLKEENKLNLCPVCNKGHLAITYSKKTKRYFVACNAYPECKTTFSLPPNGMIKKTDKKCETCGWPILIRLSKGRRPWEFCFNPNCQTNLDRIKKYEEKVKEK